MINIRSHTALPWSQAIYQECRKNGGCSLRIDDEHFCGLPDLCDKCITPEAKIEKEERDRTIELVKRRERIIRGAVKTDSPCGAKSCWEAVGEVCHCSCAGWNHGIAHDPERHEEYQKLKETNRRTP